VILLLPWRGIVSLYRLMMRTFHGTESGSSRQKVAKHGFSETTLPDLVIYDCDGTLIDSERLIADVCLKAIHGLGLTHWTMDRYYAAFVGMPGHVGWRAVSDEMGRPLPDGFNDAVDADIHRLMQTDLEALPGVRQAVEAISGARCVASSTDKHHLVANIHKAGLHDLFGEHVFSASQVRRAKPAPDVFLFSASQMGHDPRHCVVVEDSVPGVLAAVRAGMSVVGYTGAAHDPAVVQRRLVEAGAIKVVAHMDDLPLAIKTLQI
jgi:HAD superfamily hydrolase (TIGR01509 family)